MNRPDHDLIYTLFAEYEQSMFRISCGILHNPTDAEDVVQDAFLWIINNPEKISEVPSDEIRNYLFSVIVHKSINLLKKQKRHPLEDIEEHKDIASDYSVEDRAIENITISEIERVLNELSDRDYALLHSYLFEDMKPEEIADEADITPNNIRMYIKRARGRLISKLLKGGNSDDI